MTDRTPIAPDDLDEALAELPGWQPTGGHLVRTFIFGTFREATSFLVRVAFESEDMDHHPDIRIVYNQVTLSLTTHSAGNKITRADVELARRIKSFSWV